MGRTEFSAWLRHRLRSKEWSQADLARRLGADTGQVSRWASGKRLPDHRSIERLSDVLNADLDTLLALAGIRPLDRDDEDEARAHLVAMVERVELTEEREDTLRRLLEGWVERDARGRYVGTEANRPRELVRS